LLSEFPDLKGLGNSSLRVLSTANKNALEKIYIFSEAFLFARNASLIFVIGKHTLSIRKILQEK